jgi:hypothetical protein
MRLYTPIYSQVAAFKKKYGNETSLSIEFCLYRLQEKLKEFIENKNTKNVVSQSLSIENVKAFDQGLKQLRD